MKEAPIRVLHIVGAMYPGGMENFIMNLYEHIDREKIQFDFAVHARKENDYVEQIERMGGRVYELDRLTRHPVRSLVTLKKLVKRNHYPFVIRHTANALIAPQLIVAKQAGARVVCHSHSEADPQIWIHRLGKLFMPSDTIRLACSERAGQWMYGKKKFHVIKNAIDLNKFAYSREKSDRIREEFHLEGRHIYGHIGNLLEVKNHTYLLDVFQKIAEQDKQAAFFFVGEGEKRSEIEEKIARLGLRDKVILTGIRRDVENFLSAFDVLMFPSIFEGLPLSLIEAQAASLPILMSDRITENVIVTEGLVEALPIEADPKIWARRAMKLAENAGKDGMRACQRERIAEKGYDIERLSRWYEKFLTEGVLL